MFQFARGTVETVIQPLPLFFPKYRAVRIQQRGSGGLCAFAKLIGAILAGVQDVERSQAAELQTTVQQHVGPGGQRAAAQRHVLVVGLVPAARRSRNFRAASRMDSRRWLRRSRCLLRGRPMSRSTEPWRGRPAARHRPCRPRSACGSVECFSRGRPCGRTESSLDGFS